MADTSKFYLTTAIPYVNGKPHVGHALEFVQTDAIKRYQKLLGKKVLLLSGSDENALKNVQAADEAGKDVQSFVDENAKNFEELARVYNIEFDVFQKGSDHGHHFPSSQELWRLCKAKGDIYQKEYSGLYCVGCEVFYTKEELNENGECFNHPGKKVQEVKETNWFFKLSGYQEALINLVKSDTLKIYPETRKNEILGFLSEPLHDISISRSNERARNWGVPVPEDDSQRMYVWFDALNIYQSGVGFGWDQTLYETWWPADVHVIGKDIIRFHAVFWPAFLLSAGLELPKSIFAHGFVTSEGQKMSKSLGNVVDPLDFAKEYGVDAARYYLLREIPSGKDGDISSGRFKELYNADLANGLGNLIARIAKLSEGLELQGAEKTIDEAANFSPEYSQLMDNFLFDEALTWTWNKVRNLDRFMNEKEPWKMKEDAALLTKTMQQAVDELRVIAVHLEPFLPETAQKMQNQFASDTVIATDPYFKRA